MPGLFDLLIGADQYFATTRTTTPVEAIDQRAADGVNPFLGINANADQPAGGGNSNWVRLSVKLREAILGLPEQEFREYSSPAPMKQPVFLSTKRPAETPKGGPKAKLSWCCCREGTLDPKTPLPPGSATSRRIRRSSGSLHEPFQPARHLRHTADRRAGDHLECDGRTLGLRR